MQSHRADAQGGATAAIDGAAANVGGGASAPALDYARRAATDDKMAVLQGT